MDPHVLRDREENLLFEQAVGLRLPPISEPVLRILGFFLLEEPLLPRLWNIYLTLTDSRVQPEAILAEARKADSRFPTWLETQLGRETDDAKWVTKYMKRWNPMEGGILRNPLNVSWFNCVVAIERDRNLAATRVSDGLKERQQAYKTYAALFSSPGRPHLLSVYWGTDIYDQFGFNHAGPGDELQVSYYTALQNRYQVEEIVDMSTRFEAFWEHYRNNTLFSWMTQVIPEEEKLLWYFTRFERCYLSWMPNKFDTTSLKFSSVWGLRYLVRALLLTDKVDAVKVLEAVLEDYGISTNDANTPPRTMVAAYSVIFMHISPEYLHYLRIQGQLSELVAKEWTEICSPWLQEKFAELDYRQRAANLASGNRISVTGLLN